MNHDLSSKQQIIQYLSYFIELVEEDKLENVELDISDDRKNGRITFETDDFIEYNTIRRISFTASMPIRLIQNK